MLLTACQTSKTARRACARGSKFGQDASLTCSVPYGARSASEMQSCWLDKDAVRDGPCAHGKHMRVLLV